MIIEAAPESNTRGQLKKRAGFLVCNKLPPGQIIFPPIVPFAFSVSFRYDPAVQKSSFPSNDEVLMFVDPSTASTATARPRVKAALERKEHPRITVAPSSLKAPPTSVSAVWQGGGF